MKKSNKMQGVALLVLALLACGVMTPGVMTFPHPNPAPLPPVPVIVEMIVRVDEGLNIRSAPGERSPLVDGDHVLENGNMVACYQFLMVGESLWCRHERGWSNARWMKAVAENDRR